jgi:hypothetical protein
MYYGDVVYYLEQQALLAQVVLPSLQQSEPFVQLSFAQRRRLFDLARVLSDAA